MPLTILALINVVPGREAQLIASLTTLAEASRKEEGCIQYDMHLDNEDPSFIMFYETWATKELWLEHMKSEHLKVHNAATEGCIAKLALHEMTKQ
ncbi:MAG: putative quinol monooxygenase [Yoonia sp.]|nr:putative quinol monooxygenase [Yoonia sp.]